MPQMSVLKLDKGSARILSGLFLLIPSRAAPCPPQKQIDGLSSQSCATVMPMLQRIVMDAAAGDADLNQAAVGDQVGFQLDEVDKYAEWRRSCGYPVEVVRR